MPRKSIKRPTSTLPTGQDKEVGREIRSKGLLAKINELIRPEGYVLVFIYNKSDDPAEVGPLEVKFERET